MPGRNPQPNLRNDDQAQARARWHDRDHERGQRCASVGASERRTLVCGALYDAGVTDLGAGDPLHWVAEHAA